MKYSVHQITGRFRHLDVKTLEALRFKYKSLLKSWGAVGPEELGSALIDKNKEFPLWAEVEFLDNVIQFEFECNPFLPGEIRN